MNVGVDCRVLMVVLVVVADEEKKKKERGLTGSGRGRLGRVPSGVENKGGPSIVLGRAQFTPPPRVRKTNQPRWRLGAGFAVVRSVRLAACC